MNILMMSALTASGAQYFWKRGKVNVSKVTSEADWFTSELASSAAEATRSFLLHDL